MRTFSAILLFVSPLICFGQKKQSYKEVTVSNISKEEVIFKDSRYYVTDFSVSGKGKFVLVNRFKEDFIYLLDNNHNKTSELKLDFKALTLFEDCLGGIHVIGKEKAIQIWTDSLKNIQFAEIPKILYSEFYYKCVGTSDDFVFFSHYDNFNQEILYYGVEKHTQYRKNIYRIGSFEGGKNLTEEFSHIQGAVTTERMKEIDLAKLLSLRKKMNNYFFFVNVLSKPTYHPFISDEKESHIFDHFNDVAVTIDTCGNYVKSFDIDYHKNGNFQKQILFDNKKQKFYSVMGKGGNKDLMELTEQFAQGKTFKFPRNQAIDKIEIYDGYAYYLGKEEHGEILNKLYRIRVRT